MKITLGTFKDNADELATFLEPRLGAKAQVSGGELSFEDDDVKKTIRSRHVKTYVKRFLNKKGERANYQVLVDGKELRLIELERDEEEEEKKAPKQEPKKEAKPEPEEEKAEEVKGEEPEEKVSGEPKEEEDTPAAEKAPDKGPKAKKSKTA